MALYERLFHDNDLQGKLNNIISVLGFDGISMLYTIKSLRNAVAHNNIILIHDLKTEKSILY